MEDLRADYWVVSTIKECCNLELHHKPPLTSQPKDALERLHNTNTPGFYSRIFLVPKKLGDLRPVIGLKLLNTFLSTKQFKIETAQYIRTSLNQGMWVFSIGPKDLFPHSNPPICQKIPQNLHGKRSVPIQSTSF